MPGQSIKIVRDLKPKLSRSADKIWAGTLRDWMFARLSRRNCSLSTETSVEALATHIEEIRLRDHEILSREQPGIEEYYAYLTSPKTTPVDRKVGVSILTDGRVSYPTGVLCGREGIPMDAYPNHSALKNPKYALSQLAQPMMPAKSHHKSGFVLYVAWAHNFFHWVVDVLTRLTFLEAVPKDVPIVMYTGAPAFARKSLELLDLDREILWLGNGVHCFDELYVPSNLATPALVADSALSFLRGPWRDALRRHETQSLTLGLRLYISRKDAPTRRIANEDDVIRLLEGFGFQTITMSEHSLADQAALFANAECVVGAHGAAFINLAYCEPGARILEIFRRGFTSRSFYSVAEKRGLPYGLMLTDADSQGDQIVDLVVLRDLIDKLLAT